MPIAGNGFTLEPPFDHITEGLIRDLGSVDELKKLPHEVLFKVLSHPDETRFITISKAAVILSGIRGPFSVYDERRSFLYTMNLHTGCFGVTLPELDFIRRLPAYATLFVIYTDSDNLLRTIQVIKREV